MQPLPGAPVPPPAGQPAGYPVGYPVGYPGGPYPYGGVPGLYPVATYPYGPYHSAPPPRPRFGLPRPTAVAPVPGTPFAVALVEVRPTINGPSVASLAAGIGSILVSLVVLLFAAVGASEGWGPAVAGAFAVLATVAGVAGVGLGTTGLRRIRASAAWGPTVGRGAAIAGLVCAGIGLIVTALTMLVALAA